MTRYFFHIHNGQEIPDESGTVLPGVKEAREEAVKTAGELLRGDGRDFWEGPDWTMQVTDATGVPVFTIKILMDDHNGASSYSGARSRPQLAALSFLDDTHSFERRGIVW